MFDEYFAEFLQRNLVVFVIKKVAIELSELCVEQLLEFLLRVLELAVLSAVDLLSSLEQLLLLRFGEVLADLVDVRHVEVPSALSLRGVDDEAVIVDVLIVHELQRFLGYHAEVWNLVAIRPFAKFLFGLLFLVLSEVHP